MVYKIDDKCINCGLCVPECPVNAIVPGKEFHEITADCIDCGACEAICPTQAISAG